MTQITYPNQSTNTFTYNGLDTRVGKVDSAGSKTYRRDGVGVTAPVLSDGVSAFTPGISARTSGATKFLHDDRLGTLGLETDSTQATTATKTYDAFGMPISSTGSSASPFGFAGSYAYQEDSDSGLKLLGHRYYDPSTGRFLTRDPVNAGRNWYGYCENNPQRWLDPLGLEAGKVYEKEEDAAAAAMAECEAASKKDGFEWGTQILKIGENQYVYMEITTDKMKDKWLPGYILPNATAVVHSHATIHPDNSGELFSNSDKKIGDNNKVNLYLVTPRGQRKRYKYDPKKKGRGQIEVWVPKSQTWEPRRR